MGIKENSKAIFINPDEDALKSIDLPTLDISTELKEECDYIHLFAKSQSEFVNHFPKLKIYLKSNGMLWVSWPKGGKLGTDLNIKIIIKLGYDFGLVESTCLSINSIWSAIKFTHPKIGKNYNNSYGKLKVEKQLKKNESFSLDML